MRRRGGGSLNDLKSAISVGRFSRDGAASTAVKGLNSNISNWYRFIKTTLSLFRTKMFSDACKPVYKRWLVGYCLLRLSQWLCGGPMALWRWHRTRQPWRTPPRASGPSFYDVVRSPTQHTTQSYWYVLYAGLFLLDLQCLPPFFAHLLHFLTTSLSRWVLLCNCQ